MVQSLHANQAPLNKIGFIFMVAGATGEASIGQ
jgi:hypothetical protein